MSTGMRINLFLSFSSDFVLKFLFVLFLRMRGLKIAAIFLLRLFSPRIRLYARCIIPSPTGNFFFFPRPRCAANSLTLSNLCAFVQTHKKPEKFMESVKFKLCNHLFPTNPSISPTWRVSQTPTASTKKSFSLSLAFSPLAFPPETSTRRRGKMPSWLCETNGVSVTGWTWCFCHILHFPINHALKLFNVFALSLPRCKKASSAAAVFKRRKSQSQPNGNTQCGQLCGFY